MSKSKSIEPPPTPWDIKVRQEDDTPENDFGREHHWLEVGPVVSASDSAWSVDEVTPAFLWARGIISRCIVEMAPVFLYRRQQHGCSPPPMDVPTWREGLYSFDWDTSYRWTWCGRMWLLSLNDAPDPYDPPTISVAVDDVKQAKRDIERTLATIVKMEQQRRPSGASDTHIPTPTVRSIEQKASQQ